MSSIFITGSSDGLRLMSARLLLDAGHEVVLHARNAARRRGALTALPDARVGALSIEQAGVSGVTKAASLRHAGPPGCTGGVPT